MPESPTERTWLHWFFEISVVVKGVNGALGVVLGFIILFFKRDIVRAFLLFFVQGELNEDPRDWISNQLLHLGNRITPSSELFMGVFFLVDGIVKLILVYGLLRGKLWSYPAALSILSAFGVYELYRFTHTHSLILATLFLFDIITIFLIADEWKNRSLLNDSSGSAKQETADVSGANER